MDHCLRTPSLLAGVLAACVAGCGGIATPDDGDRADDTTIPEGSCQAQQVLAVANTATLAELDDQVGLDSRAAEAIVDAREDGPFETIAALDAVRFVGSSALAKLLTHAESEGVECEAQTVIVVPLLDEEEQEPLSRFNDQIVAAGEEPLPDTVDIASRDDWDAMMERVNALAEKIGIPFASAFAGGPNELPGVCYRGKGDELADLTDSLSDNVFSDMYFVLGWRFHDQLETLEDIDPDTFGEEVPEWDEFKGDNDDVLIVHSEGDDGIAVPAIVPPCE